MLIQGIEIPNFYRIIEDDEAIAHLELQVELAQNETNPVHVVISIRYIEGYIAGFHKANMMGLQRQIDWFNNN